MRLLHDQRGVGYVVIFLAVAVIAVVGVAGYRVANPTKTTTSSSTSVILHTSEPQAIKSTTDLKKATQSLDTTSIDSGVNPNQLDEDLNSVL